MALRLGPEGTLIDDIPPGAELDFGFAYGLDEGEEITESEWRIIPAGAAEIITSGRDGASVFAFVKCQTLGTVFVLQNLSKTSVSPRRLSKSITLTCRHV